MRGTSSFNRCPDGVTNLMGQTEPDGGDTQGQVGAGKGEKETGASRRRRGGGLKGERKGACSLGREGAGVGGQGLRDMPPGLCPVPRRGPQTQCKRKRPGAVGMPEGRVRSMCARVCISLCAHMHMHRCASEYARGEGQRQEIQGTVGTPWRGRWPGTGAPWWGQRPRSHELPPSLGSS